MGCDIHLRVEYRLPGETVALVDGQVRVVPATGQTETVVVGGETITIERDPLEIGTIVWTPAETLTNKTPENAKADYWINIVDKDEAVRDPATGRETGERVPRTPEDLAEDQARYDELPDQYVRYEDEWYHGRDYQLFSALVPGLRGDSDNAVFEERGWPDDASLLNQEYMEEWGLDGHSPSWQTLAELETVDWDAKLSWTYSMPDGKSVEGRNGEWENLLQRMRELADDKCGGDRTAVRIVYFFDN